METYDSSMAARFRAALLEQASQFGAVLDADAQIGSETADHEVADLKDVAARDMETVVADSQALHASAELEQIGAALSRIRSGSYGRCLDCGDPIDLRRLAAMPAALYCASCQGTHERANALHG